MSSQVRLTTVVVFVRAVVDTSTRPSHNNGLTRESLSNFFFSDKFPKENIERCRRKKKGRKTRHQESLTAVRTIAGDQSPATYSLEAAEKKEAWVSFVVAKTHTLLAIKLISPTARSPKLFYRFLPRQTPRTR
jgi:hypothetical protein